MTRAFVVAVLLALLVAGCAGPPPGKEQPARGPRVVVAMIDTGIQPYHEAFRLRSSANQEWLGSLPNLTRIAPASIPEPTDPSLWNLERKTLYWFEGTRVLGIDLTRPEDLLPGQEERAVIDDGGHGTMTASMVARESPEAFLLMVKTPNTQGVFEWLRNQTWVDIASVSLGYDVPFSAANTVYPGAYAAPKAVRDLADRGVPAFFGTGNDPLPTVDTEPGMPWVIAVGGAGYESQGSPPLSRGPPDLVANYTDLHLANASNLTGYRAASGTSFSAPAAAGVAAETLYRLRAAANWTGGIRDGALVTLHGKPVTAKDLRDALNATAVYWNTSDFHPQPPGGIDTRDFGNLTVPVFPDTGTQVGPWQQMGWGWVGPELMPRLVAEFQGEQPLPQKPAAAVAYMQEAYQARQAYWAQAGR